MPHVNQAQGAKGIQVHEEEEHIDSNGKAICDLFSSVKDFGEFYPPSMVIVFINLFNGFV